MLIRTLTTDDVVPYKSEAAVLERLIGRVGTTITPMNPGGMVRVENERLHATTEGLLMAIGNAIEVIGVNGNRVIVRRARPGLLASAGQVSPETAPASPPEPERLDFDVPQD